MSPHPAPTSTEPSSEPLNSLVLDDHAQRALFLDARSNTNFADREVPADLIHDVYELIKWGPTGNNAVPLRLVIARSTEARQKVIANANEGNRPKLEKAPLIVVVARDNRYHDQFTVTSPGAESVAARLEHAPDERALKAHNGSWLQAGYLIVGLRAAGLAVRPYGGFNPAALDEALLGDTSWGSEMLLAVGYPDPSDHGAGPRRGRVPADVAIAEL